MTLDFDPAVSSHPTLRVRLASMVYEALLVAAVLAVFFLLPQTLVAVVTEAAIPAPLTRLHFVGLLLVYFVGFWLKGGQTLAMKTWRLRVVSARDTPLTPLQLVMRFFWAWPSILMLGGGIFWALLDREGQFLHDRLAGTRLVRLPKDKPLNANV